MHWNVAIPDYRSLVTQTSRMDICQIGYDICEFDSLRGLGIDIIGGVHFNNWDRFSISMGSIGTMSTNNRVVADIWVLTVSWTLICEMIRIRNFYCFLYRQHIWLRKWEVIVWRHDWSCWDLWIWGGRGFVDVQPRSCKHQAINGHKQTCKVLLRSLNMWKTDTITFSRIFKTHISVIRSGYVIFIPIFSS